MKKYKLRGGGGFEPPTYTLHRVQSLDPRGTCVYVFDTKALLLAIPILINVLGSIGVGLVHTVSTYTRRISY